MDEDKKRELVRYINAKIAQAPAFSESRIYANNKQLPHRNAFFKLQKYAESFINEEKGSAERRIIILPGLRGVGKTTILLQLYNFLTKNKGLKEEKVIYFSTDELKDFIGSSISEMLNVFFDEVIKTSPVFLKEKLFILIDEAHFDENWDRTAKVISDQSKNIFLAITGSSALSMEISPDLARRSLKEKVFPLNFPEYLLLKYGLEISEISELIKSLIFSPSDAIIKEISRKEMEIIKLSSKIKKDIHHEFLSFISFNDMPFSLDFEEKEVYERIISMIDRVIEKDIFSVYSFKSESQEVIKRIIYFLASQSPGGTSDAKLAKHLETSSKQIRGILNILEKTQLIFSIKPYAGAGKLVRKPWKYYFLSPSINSAIRFKLGSFDRNNHEMFGVLVENLVASYFIRMKETFNKPTGIFYDSDDGGVDFLIQDSKENIIPVEVGYGSKDGSQVKKAIKKFNSKYGIVICKCQTIKKEDNIIYIPITTFSFV